MPGENETTTTEPVEQTTVADPATETQETAHPTETPHPLQPGGVRFEEVYGKWKAEERAAQMLREENDRLRTQPQAPQTQSQTPQFYTQDQLQKFVDEGKISLAQMSGQLALQAKELAKQEMRAELAQTSRVTSAQAEINEYISKLPKLNDTASPEFQKVTRVAWEIAGELGLDVKDARVQKRALREAFGPLDRITSAERTREYDRRHADTHTETGGGGGTRQTQADPLKNVEPARIEFWKSRGYTREQMIEEARFIRRPLRTR